MDRRHYRWALRIAAVLVGAVAFLLWVTQAPPPNRLTITNQSRQSIAELNVAIAGQLSTFTDVAAGAAVSAALPAKGEVPFIVAGRLGDGKLIRVQGKAAEHLDMIVQPTGEFTFSHAGK